MRRSIILVYIFCIPSCVLQGSIFAPLRQIFFKRAIIPAVETFSRHANISYNTAADFVNNDLDKKIREDMQRYHPGLTNFKWHLDQQWCLQRKPNPADDSMGVPISYALSIYRGNKNPLDRGAKFHEKLGHGFYDPDLSLHKTLQKQLENDEITYGRYEKKRLEEEWFADASVPRDPLMLLDMAEYYDNRDCWHEEEVNSRTIDDIPTRHDVQQAFKERIERSPLSIEQKNRVWRMCNLPYNVHPTDRQRAHFFLEQAQNTLGDRDLARKANDKAKRVLGI